MKIGNRRVLISETLFVPDGEIAEIEKEVNEGEILRLRLMFPQGVLHEGTTNPVILYEQKNDWFELRFANFTDALGAFSNSPYVFAMSRKGEKIAYMATVGKRPSHMKLELQVMLELQP